MAKISIIPWIVKKLKRCIGIVEDTDTASQAIASNKYVIWKGDVCKSTSAISEGDMLSSSNLSAVSGGVGNDLLQDIANINTQIASETKSFAFGTCYKFGKLVVLSFNNNSTSMTTSGYTLPYTAKYVTSAAARYYNGSANDSGSVKVDDTKVYLYGSGGSLANGTYITGQIVYMTDD